MALQLGRNAVYVRVIAVGPGLLLVTKAPGDHYMIYEAGNWTRNYRLEALSEFVASKTIHLLIISHSDAEHPRGADNNLEETQVRQVIRTGFRVGAVSAGDGRAR